MSFSSEIYSKAREIIAERHSNAKADAESRRTAFVAEHPEYAQMQSMLSRTGYELAKTIFRDGAGSDEISEIRDKNLELQRKMNALLTGAGYDENYLEPKYTCSVCSDTGIFRGKVCECVNKLMRQLAYDRLNRETPLELCSFDAFTFDQYSDELNSKGVSPRRMMQITFNKCRNYAAEFSLNSPSLLFCGGVGLGKTHLSLAIAGEVIKKGYDVVYGSASSFFTKIEKERFSRGTSQEDTLSLLNSCDLLIIDDLGAEFVTQLSISILYEIVNTRLLRGFPTIISTNFNAYGLEQKYSDRIFSRFTGGYSLVPFEGADMRLILRKKNNAKKTNE